jgi:CBS-domain-containing membrane protein
LETPESITENTPIREADQLLDIDAILVRPEDELGRVAQAAAEQRERSYAISVVDDAGRLAGVIPLRELLDAVFIRIVPEDFIAEIIDFDQVVEYTRRMRARTAGDIMREPISVRMDDTVGDAFERMHHNNLYGLPITDESNRVIGYVDQLELLMVWVRASRSGSSSGGEPEEES